VYTDGTYNKISAIWDVIQWRLVHNLPATRRNVLPSLGHGDGKFPPETYALLHDVIFKVISISPYCKPHVSQLTTKLHIKCRLHWIDKKSKVIPVTGREGP
jgi:hypothetical protein